MIDVPSSAEGRILRVLMNADQDEAVGFLVQPAVTAGARSEQRFAAQEPHLEEPSRWRQQMVQRIAEQLDAQRYGVKALYVIGSTKNATAGPASDIDLLVHVDGTPEQRNALAEWLDGWSRALAEMNYLRTGYRPQQLLDVRFVTDEDIAAKRDDFAAKIGAVTDPAREVKLRVSS